MMVALQRQLETLRPALLRFAILQLRNEALAEDMARDTLFAVLKSRNSSPGNRRCIPTSPAS
jgi:RNA polymerase sigma-70 factor (ECF subfamily)